MVYTTVQFFNMVFVAEWFRRKFVALVYAGSNPVEHPILILSIMVKVFGENVEKCYRCRMFIEYDEADIEEKECSYDGETYVGNFINCPSCGHKIEVY